MKKIMIVRDRYARDCWDNGVSYMDVSTADLMDKAYRWLFKNLGGIDAMETEIAEFKDDEANTIYMSDCDFCDKTGKVDVKGKTIWCPECCGRKRDPKSWKQWHNSMENFKKAKDGDINAIKKFLNDFRDQFGLDNWSISKVKTPR